MALKKTTLPELPPEKTNEPPRLKLAREIHWMLMDDPYVTYEEIGRRLHYSEDHIRSVARSPFEREVPKGTCRVCGGKTSRTDYARCRKCYDKSGEKYAPCGTSSAYRRGCRCADCTEAHRIFMRNYRQRRKERQCTQQRL